MTYLHPENWSYLELFKFFAPKAFFAVICGGVIGLERELKNKPAGIKTNILICLGAAIYTTVSVLISGSFAAENHFGDPARISAQIVSGIGFLGGGAIIQARGTIVGLTTAATIWVVAALGIAIGIGYHDVAVALSVMTILILVGVSYFEDRVLGRSLTFKMEILLEDDKGQTRQEIHSLLAANDLILVAFDLDDKNHLKLVRMKYSGHRDDQRNFSLSLWGTPGVKEIRNI